MLSEEVASKGTVVISLEEYNAMVETMHLLSSRKNADHLYESISQMKSGDIVSSKLLEE